MKQRHEPSGKNSPGAVGQDLPLFLLLLFLLLLCLRRRFLGFLTTLTRLGGWTLTRPGGWTLSRPGGWTLTRPAGWPATHI